MKCLLVLLRMHVTRLTKKPKNCYRYLLRVRSCRSLIYIFRLRWTKWHFPQFKKCKSHRWTWFAAAPREFLMSEKTTVMLFKFSNIIAIKNRYCFYENDLIQIFFYAGCTVASLYWWSNLLETLVYYSSKFYNVYFLLSFSCSQGQNIWEIS